MVKDDGEAARSNKTLEAPNPHGKICKGNPDGHNLAGSGDTRIGKGMENGSRVSADGKDDECVDDIGMTLVELSSKRGGKKGTHQRKAGAKEASKLGNGGEIDAKSVSTSDSGGASLRRSKRNRIVVDPGDGSKKLKKKHNDGEKGKEEKEPEDEDEDDDDDDDEEESEFAVGDFVWGKVKSHPWWPGRVFDPSEASEQALKYKHEGRILVAYFGDATFAWCDSSQLKPFVENFAEMSKQSTSKSFRNAVEEAVSEFARLVELDMTCYCTPRKNQNAHQQVSVNAGIKGGVNVDRGGLGVYSVDRFDPAAFLGDLRLVGKYVSVANVLRMTTLKSQVSAIYRPKDGNLLLKFNELQKAAEGEVDGARMEDSFQGPVEDPNQIMPGTPDGLVASKRKERSVAEILYGNEKGNEEGKQTGNMDAKSETKKRKVADESQKKAGDEEKKTGDQEAPKSKIVYGDEAEEDRKTGRRSSRMKMKESPKPVVVESNVAAIEESEMSPRSRERKRSRFLSPPYTNLEYYRQTAVSSPRGPEAKAVESSNVSQKGDTSARSTAQLKVAPPLVNCGAETSKKKLGKGNGAEHGKPNGSAPRTPRRSSGRKVAGDPTKSIASSDNVLSEIRTAALSGKASKEDQSFGSVKGFLTSYRSKNYQNGSDYSPCEGSDAGGRSREKGKSKEIKRRLDKEDANQESKSLKKSRTKREKVNMENKVKEENSKTVGKVKGANPSAALQLKFPPDYPLPSKDDLDARYVKFGALDTSKTQVSKKSSSARLVFLRGSDAEAAFKSSKASSPFGAAEVSYRIRHLRTIPRDREVAENGPMKKDSTSDLQKRTRSSQKQPTTSTSDGGLKLVKQKLQGMVTMVADAGDGKMPKAMKSNLESRLKDLLKELKAHPALPSSSKSGV